MAYLRQNVWELGGDWADPILWYARGVGAMKALPLAEPSAWRFYGAMHGFLSPLWKELGYLSKTDKLPSSGLQKQFWKQCQHGSWYFLPWHRGYLIAFEATVRAEIVKLGGPSDWALPYWNYFKAGESALPPAFASADWPDGKGNNPLFVIQRYGPNNDGNVYVPLNEVNLNALTDPDFTGVASGGSPGFGGVDTGFMHSGTVHGGLETQPHDYVHGLVGGSNPKNTQQPGLMSDPDSAGLDPIFWLHHGNIDRLWEVWRQNPASHLNPTDPKWLGGPASHGGRAFMMPMPDGTTWTYKPSDMVDLAALGYSYDDYSEAVAVPAPAVRLEALGFTVSAGEKAAGAHIMKAQNSVEMVGATKGAVSVVGTDIATSVVLDKTVRQKVSASLTPGLGKTAPDRVFLNLENVRGTVDSTAFHVYVGIPDGSSPSDHPELLAGSIALFGVRKASQPDEEHGGEGLTFVLEITKIVDKLHIDNSLDVDSLNVRLVPIHEVSKDANVSVGRISIYRQGLSG